LTDDLSGPRIEKEGARPAISGLDRSARLLSQNQLGWNALAVAIEDRKDGIERQLLARVCLTLKDCGSIHVCLDLPLKRKNRAGDRHYQDHYASDAPGEQMQPKENSSNRLHPEPQNIEYPLSPMNLKVI
jgi:hypothetical protein